MASNSVAAASDSWVFPARFAGLIKESADAWIDDNVPRLSASLAFYSVTALVPFLIVIVAVSARVFGREAAQGQLRWDIENFIGVEGAQAIRGMMQMNRHSVTLTAVSLITLAFGTSAVVMELRDALNTIWHVQVSGSTGFRGFLKTIQERFYLFALIVAAGILLVASLAVNSVITLVTTRMGIFFPVSPTFLHVIVFLGSFLIITGIFAAIYKLVPDVRLRWNDVIVGAAFTSLLFMTGKQIIGVYLGSAGYNSTYGAAGSFLIVLLWVYYSAQLFFFGAEFTRVFARRIHPRKSIEPHT